MRMLSCCEMGVLVATLLFSGVAASASNGLLEKALVFPSRSKTSYVALTPLKHLELKAFTLCMNVAADFKGCRRVILFAYRTRDCDELNIWRLSDGSYSLFLCKGQVTFNIPPLSSFKTQLCITWESTTGLSAFWVDGKRSVRKVYRKGHNIQSKGTVILGQDPDRFLGWFSYSESFVGEISDVNMWDYVLPEKQIKALHSCGEHVPRGNILDWDTIQYQIHGNVIVASANS